jgi:ammonia channel protein AmtB
VFPLTAGETEESEGLDMSMHGEEAYVHGGGSDSV